MKNKKGFTLVELLAVIAILAILVIIALPNVMNMYNKAQKETFLTEAKKVYSESEKKYISNSISNKQTKVINSEDDTKLDMTGEKLQYCVILNNSGKVTNMKVSNGKWVASLENGKTVDSLTIDDLEEGNLDNYKCSSNGISDVETIYCTFDGELTQGAEYINGQYTYRYMQSKSLPNFDGENSTALWQNISDDGWGVALTDLDSTSPVTSKVCTYVNNKPVVSMAGMFTQSKASSIDLSSFNTELINDMSGMFGATSAKNLNLSTFDTKNVTNMLAMFAYSKATSINGLDKFNTSNVTNMAMMFAVTETITLDLSSFDTSKVTAMNDMFEACTNLKTIYASDKFVTNNVAYSDYMFRDDTKLVGGAGTKYSSSNIDKTYARIDGGSSNPGYFTKK